MPVYLLIAALIIIACLICNKISSKLGVPMLLVFILMGMVFGSDGIIKIDFDNFGFAEEICSIALIFIMFYGGFGTKWSEAKPIATKAVLLSSLGVIMTAGITGLFCHYIMGMGLLEGMLIGSVIGSTDAASVFSILRSKRLNLKYNTASLLEVESGSNDPCAYMLTAIFLSVIKGQVNGGGIAYMLFAQIVYGLILGAVTAVAAKWALSKFRFSTKGFDTIFVFAAVLLAYAAPSALGGNGYLSVYIFGIILGNGQLRDKKTLVHFFDGITGLMQMLLFFLLGLLSFPSKLPSVMLPALIIALFLTFIARPASVFAIMSPFRSNVRQQVLVSWAGLRGAASIVFAIMAMVSGVDSNNDIFHIVFCIVLFSILLQGSLLPYMAKKLNMIDQSTDVLKTFNDYTEEVPVQFIQFTVTENHPWENKAVREVAIPPETLFVQLRRGDEQIAPDGSTVLRAGDVMTLSAKPPQDAEDINLTELTLVKGHEWIGKSVASIAMEPGKLIILIRRKQNAVIPGGKTVLEEDDVLVISQYGQ